MWDEIKSSALRQCIIWQFHLLASISGGCCAVKEVSEVVCTCVRVCEDAHMCVSGVSRVVQCLIEQDGAPPSLILLHFIRLDDLSYNCIRGLTPLLYLPLLLNLSPQQGAHATPQP
ncbi:hypothetical protein CHARACLAT_001840 [Characodon lateralis]|uniref:Uncharacterized protein n=1 Tax=Characodon lateralis TaxID=208331 RepID=A0ABU7EQN2_9TELE|nr:hypothetical protein [Characodon lateralis]